MEPTVRSLAPGWGRLAIALLGLAYVASVMAWAVIRAGEGEPTVSLLLVVVLTAGPSLFLLSGVIYLSRIDIDPDFHLLVARWCVSGVILMAGLLAVYHFQPADSLSHPYRSVLMLTALSSVAGYGVGVHDARSRTQARELRRRNRELEQLQARIEASNDRLEASNDRLEQFAYAASHDLQEPLRMITSYLTLLERRRGDALDDDCREFIEYAVDGAERMKSMIDALLEYSRVETQGDPFEPVDLESVLADVEQNLERRIDESDAVIEVGELPRVTGDRSQLAQVLQNLLNNAIEYSGDERPRIRVDAERTGTMWTVTIRDDGIGIPPDEQDRVFEVFQRLHTREEHAGTGIGLALCKRIVERHDGRIWVDSEPGEGSTFSLTLPAADDEAH